MTSQQLEVGVSGAVLHAEQAPGADPAAPALVFLHAGVSDGRLWQPQWDAFGRHPRLRYDRRGFGRTRTEAPTPYSRTADLWAVMDTAGVGRAVLVGCSQGGRVAVDAALARPERVAALVLVAPAIHGAPQPALEGAVKALDEAIDAAIDAGRLHDANELEAHLWLDGPLAPRGRVGGAERALFLAMNAIALAAPDPGPAAEEPLAWPRLEALRLPTLVLWGDLDLPHLQQRCERLAQRIPGARTARLAGTAHLPNLEAPARFNAALAAFLAGL